jgi:hypothetical protein
LVFLFFSYHNDARSSKHQIYWNCWTLSNSPTYTISGIYQAQELYSNINTSPCDLTTGSSGNMHDYKCIKYFCQLQSFNASFLKWPYTKKKSLLTGIFSLNLKKQICNVKVPTWGRKRKAKKLYAIKNVCKWMSHLTLILLM